MTPVSREPGAAGEEGEGLALGGKEGSQGSAVIWGQDGPSGDLEEKV